MILLPANPLSMNMLYFIDISILPISPVLLVVLIKLLLLIVSLISIRTIVRMLRCLSSNIRKLIWKDLFDYFLSSKLSFKMKTNQRYLDNTASGATCEACPTTNANTATCTCNSGFRLITGLDCSQCSANQYLRNELTCTTCPTNTESFIESTTCTCASGYTQSSTICIQTTALSTVQSSY